MRVLVSRQALLVCVLLLGLLGVVVGLALTGPRRSAGEWVAGGVAAAVIVAMLARWAGQAALWVSRGRCCRPLRPALPSRRITEVQVTRAPLSRWVPDHRVVVVPEAGRELWVLPSLSADLTVQQGRELAGQLGVRFVEPELDD